MSESMKSIVVVEDQKAQREGLMTTLTQYRFSPFGGATIADALDLLREHKDDAAVIIIDMELSTFPDYEEHVKKEGSEITGIALARNVLKESKGHRPEIIIHSIYGDRSEYYKQAIEAGASAFSRKGDETDRGKFVAVIQALALKHSFQPNPNNETELARLAEGHANSFELLEYFCRHKLVPELELCLADSPLILLFQMQQADALGGSGNFRFVHSNVNCIPETGDFDYANLHQQIINQKKLDHPSYSIYTPEASLFSNGKAERLKEFIFVELVEAPEIQIALGIMTPFHLHDEFGEHPFSTHSLAEALLEHATPSLEAFVQKLLFRWREKQSVTIEKVETSVGLSGNVQRRLGPLVRDQRLGLGVKASEPLDGLKQLSEDLTDYNRVLSALLERQTAVSGGGETTRLSDVVQEIKTYYDRLGHFDEISFTVLTDCLVPASRYYFSQALRALVAWAFQRRFEVSKDERQVVSFRCAVQGNWLEVYFQENSERLSKRVRDTYLFEPMSPLQVAQMIIEMACHGKLIDATEELKTKAGHLFKFRLLQN